MVENDITGLWKLSLFTSILQIIPLAFIFLLPATSQEQEALGSLKTRNKYCGMLFLVVLLGSILWTCCTAMIELYHNWIF